MRMKKYVPELNTSICIIVLHCMYEEEWVKREWDQQIRNQKKQWIYDTPIRFSGWYVYSVWVG